MNKYRAGDRVRFVDTSGELASHLYAEILVGAEGCVMYGPDRDGDYRIVPDPSALGDAWGRGLCLTDVWIHGSCLTKIEE